MNLVFFFNDTATTEIYTLSLHDALPIYVIELKAHGLLLQRSRTRSWPSNRDTQGMILVPEAFSASERDRKSTRLNSSHANISYAVFCLKKKNPTRCARDSDPSVSLRHLN